MQENLYYKCNLASITTYSTSKSNTHLCFLGVYGSYSACVYIYKQFKTLRTGDADLRF